MTTRAAIVAEAKLWLRTPYADRQCVRGAGVDCVMLAIGVYANVGMVEIFHPEYMPDYMMHRNEEKYEATVLKYMRRTATPLPGDLALWRFGHVFSHSAIVIDWPVIIHAVKKLRMVSYGDGERDGMLRTKAGKPRALRFYTAFAGE